MTEPKPFLILMDLVDTTFAMVETTKEAAEKRIQGSNPAYWNARIYDLRTAQLVAHRRIAGAK